jgi:hypothetical protein
VRSLGTLLSKHAQEALGCAMSTAFTFCRPPGEQSLTVYHRLAPYEKRVIELLRNSKDKRARRLAKKRVRLLSPSARMQPRHDHTLTPHSSVPSAVRRGRLRR